MYRKCKNEKDCRKYENFENMEEKTVSIIQPLFLFCIMFMFYIFYFRIFKRRFHMANDYRRKTKNKKKFTRPMISLCLNDIVIKITNDNVTIVENALEPFFELCANSELFVIAEIANDIQEKNIINLFKNLNIFSRGLKEHRLMFCNTSSGRASMIRQLSPLTHADNNETVINTLTGKIPNVVKIYENINNENTQLFTTLQTFTQIITAVAGVEELNAD